MPSDHSYCERPQEPSLILRSAGTRLAHTATMASGDADMVETSEFVLSQELVPPHEGGVSHDAPLSCHAVLALPVADTLTSPCDVFSCTLLPAIMPCRL